MVLLQLVWWEWLHSSVEEGVSPLDHHLLHPTDVVFHQSDELVNFGDDVHCVFDEWVDTLGAPSQGLDTWLESFVDSLNPVIQEWLLNIEEGSEDLVIDVNDDVEVSLLASVDIDVLVELRSCLRHLNVQELEVLDFPQQPNKNWVKVYSYQSFSDSWACFFSVEQELVEVVVSLLGDTGFPL